MQRRTTKGPSGLVADRSLIARSAREKRSLSLYTYAGRTLASPAGGITKKDLVSPHDLKDVFFDIRNHLAANLTGATRDETLARQVIDLLLCKVHDEVSATSADAVMQFQVLPGETQSEFVRRFNAFFEETRTAYSDLVPGDERISLDPSNLRWTIETLQGFSLQSAERDALGDAFETFIGPALRGGEGQFFTPRNLIDMMVRMVDPKAGERAIDPACGSGGFLISILKHVSGSKSPAQFSRGSGAIICGIDKDSFLASVARAYMAIVGDGRSGIHCANSLGLWNSWPDRVRSDIRSESFDVLVTNPPFGARIPVRGQDLLSQFELAHEWTKDQQEDSGWRPTPKLKDAEAPQVLFIERCLELLKEGGRMAIVLPEGILGNASTSYVRAFIRSKAQVLAVIDCPLETFLPSTPTKVNVLVLEKRRIASKG
jgi:type I restriction enzyme M protein